MNSGVTYQINSIVFVNPNTGWMVGNNLNTNLSKSTNGGLNWFPQTSNSTEGLLKLTFEKLNPFGVGVELLFTL